MQFNYSIQIFIGLLMLSDVKSYLFYSFWWFLPQLEGPTTALPSGSRDPESQARTHRVARESRSWTRLGMALVVRRAPHLDDEICHTPLGSIGQRRKSMKIRYPDELKGKLRQRPSDFEEMNKIEEAMPHQLLVLWSTDDQCHRFHPLALWLGLWVQGPIVLWLLLAIWILTNGISPTWHRKDSYISIYIYIFLQFLTLLYGLNMKDVDTTNFLQVTPKKGHRIIRILPRHCCGIAYTRPFPKAPATEVRPR